MFMGLDIGTTNVKASVYEADGRLLAQASLPYGRKNTDTRICPEQVWQAVKLAVRKTCAQLSDGGAIEALAISTFGECCIPVDADGEPLYDVLLGHAPEGGEELAQTLDLLPESRIREITGLLCHPRFPLFRIQWFRNHTDLYERAYKFLTMEDYIACRLTGRFAASQSSAGRTMLWDRNRKAWSEELLQLCRIAPKKLPKVIPSGAWIGTVRGKLADELGLRGDVQVFAGGHDQMCNAIGTGVYSEETAFTGSGTVECIASVIGDKASQCAANQLPMQMSDFPVRGKTFTFWAPVAGCSALDWCLQLLGYDLSEDGQKRAHSMVQSKCSHGPSNVLVTPYLNGRNYPQYNSQVKISMQWLSLNTKMEQIYQGMMEGICFEMKNCLDLWRLQGISPRALAAAGGGAQSDYWLQMKANVSGLPVKRPENLEAGTMGAMLLAAVGTGAYPTMEDAIAACVRYSRVFLPEPLRVEQYNTAYKTYLQFRETVERKHK